MAKTLLITGAGGYIGSEMVAGFLKAGYRVKALDRFFFGKEVLGREQSNPLLELIKEDSRSISGSLLKDVFAVIDLAGLSNDPSCDLEPRLTNEINLAAPIRLARLAKENGVQKYLFASSCSVYGAGVEDWLTEESQTAPVSLYAKAKLGVEAEIRKLADNRFTVTILRNATCYGISRRMRFDLAVNLMTLHAFKYRRITIMGGGAQRRPFVHVRDVMRAYEMVLNADPSRVQNQIFNVGSNDQNYRISQLGLHVKEHFPEATIDYAPDDPDKRDYRVCFDKITKVIGFSPSLRVSDGIKEIREGLLRGEITDDLKTMTVKYYKYLIDADALLREVKHNGVLF